MRIAFFSTCVWNYYQRLTPLCAELARRGVEAVFVEPIVYAGATAEHLVPSGAQPVPDGVRVVQRKSSIPRGVVHAIEHNLANLRDIERLRPDAVVLESAAFGLLPALLHRFTRVKVALDYIDDWPEWSEFAWEKEALRRALIPAVARLADVCMVTAELLGRDLEGAARRIAYVPNGAARMPEPISEAGLRAGRGALYVGQLTARIDVEFIVELARMLPEVPFTVLGGGDRHARLAEAARALPNLRAPGPVPHEEAVSAMREAAVCLVPYVRSRLADRCLPIKLVEYWAAGRAVLATPCHEIQRVGAGAALFASSPAEAAPILKRLAEGADERARLGRAGWELARRYNYEVIAGDFLAALGFAESSAPGAEARA